VKGLCLVASTNRLVLAIFFVELLSVKEIFTVTHLRSHFYKIRRQNFCTINLCHVSKRNAV
jgi:hypothetical protein